MNRSPSDPHEASGAPLPAGPAQEPSLQELFAKVPTSDLRHRLVGLNELLDVTRDLAAEIDLVKILESITSGACKSLGCDRASLYQFDPETEELFTRVVTELEIGEIRSNIDRGITGHVARTRQVANVSDPQADPHWNSSVDRATGYTTRNILAAPVVSLNDGALLGVLQCLNKASGPFDAFDEQLLLAFTQHAAVALDRARMVEELQKRRAVETSLNVAREIQRGFMPSRLPEIPGYEVATWWLPNEAVGGDYCDLVPLRDGRMGLVIADVSGHGIGPSLIMATVRSALRTLALEHSSPVTMMQRLNGSLAEDLTDGRFITAVLATLDPTSHIVEYVNAGHSPAIHFSGDDGASEDLEVTSLPLGVMPDADFVAGPFVRLDEGDLLVLCTDGIVEAMDEENRMFGKQQLRQLIRENRRLPVADLVKRIGRTVEEHIAGETPDDDLTVLALRRTG